MTIDMESPGGDRAFFELRFRPCLELVSTVRRFVSGFYSAVLHDADLGSRLALATHELVENAVKFATSAETTLQVEVTRSTGLARVVSWNDADPTNVANLQRLLRAMREAPSALAYYEGLLTGEVEAVSSSGLGLARIGAEAEMSLSCEVKGSVVCIAARTPLREGAA
ncbi:MAG TPA: hypothetical protein VJT73_16475 [Polyangiaceae bacterium]|nr:hypothetical protein [Polyangiaceae bacterium]